MARQEVNDEMGTDYVFGEEGKLVQVSRDETPLIKSLSGTKTII